ncbi:MAG: hypothetical protein HOO86_07430 [Bacteroidales bacterium]|nr:hypothetical protein [Bacteroidales bacterium]
MKKTLLIIIVNLLSLYGWSQREVISLTFNAKDSLTQSSLNLDSINVYNVTEDCDTTLFDAVSELTMDAIWVNLEEITIGASASFVVMQNTPNPFQGKTLVRIYLKNKGELNLEVYDNQGKRLSEYQNDFEKGWHLFSVATKTTQQLYLRVFDNSTLKTIKIMSIAPVSGDDRISYKGVTGQEDESLKSVTNETGFIFYLGNMLRYTAFVEGYHDNVLYDNPVSSETYTFVMLPITTIILPTVFTSPISEITRISAIGGGEVVSDGGATVTERGVCWSVNQNPDTDDEHTSDGSGTGSYTSNITGLVANTTYFVRSYATNNVGTSYGDQQIFTTLQNPVVPEVTTTVVTNITQTTAISGGNVISDGGATVTERGVCWSVNQNPTIGDNHTSDGGGTGSYTSNITGLEANTTYFVRSYATNNVGTSYGDQQIFTTLQNPVVPEVTTTVVTNITQTTATSGGNVITDGGATVTERGVCWSVNQNPTIGDNHTSDGSGTGSYTSNIIGLEANTTYFVRSYATNNVGTSYGDQQIFTTLQNPVIPEVTTTVVTNISQTTATSGGNVITDGGATVTERGVCWSTSENPTTADSHTSNGSGTGTYISNITGLVAETNYYVRAYATNSIGTSYGQNIAFVSQTTEASLTDFDGNIYSTIVIGNQEWLGENLKVTHYNNGAHIINAIDNNHWVGLNTGGYCWYNNDSATYGETYGATYNWYATVDERKLCPIGSHVPTDAEWTILETYLGGNSNNAGGKLKEEGLTHWYSPNTGATNESDFTGLPGGGRVSNGSYENLGYIAEWWSSTEINEFNGWSRVLSFGTASISRINYYKQVGLSVRCIIDAEDPVTLNIITIVASEIEQTTATSGGNITYDGGSSVTARGVCWSTSQNPTIDDSHTIDGEGSGIYSSSIVGLNAGTTYFVRAYAINSVGIYYGDNISFTTQIDDATLSDIDGNMYSTIVIGTQEWMGENLKVTHYNNGDEIPYITDYSQWWSLTTGAFCWYYNNEDIYRDTYGAMYNWLAVVDSRNLCPTGYHIPTDAEWMILGNFLGGNSNNAGGKLKETGLSHWNSPNTGATNETDFTGLPGGYRGTSSFYNLGVAGSWWSVNEFDNSNAWYSLLTKSSGNFDMHNVNKRIGISVRCLKD